jgi:CHAT domain-containing protein
VSLVASLGVLQQLRDWNPSAGDGPILALGDPDYTTGADRPTRMTFFGKDLPRLVESGPEVRAIVDRERKDVALLGTDATEASLRHGLFEAPYPFAVLHLSCHGHLHQEVPWLSALALHATPEDDGVLTVDELTSWRFQAGPRLVVLAACQSGLGRPVAGEGEDGLVRAFLLAGARNVVASLWNVPDDASRDLMIAFHRHRRDERLSPSRALRVAQQEARKAGGTRARPVAWAGWAVWGPAD